MKRKNYVYVQYRCIFNHVPGEVETDGTNISVHMGDLDGVPGLLPDPLRPFGE